MLHNRLGESYLGCTCRSRVPVSYKNCLLKYKLMSYPFRVQFDRRGRGEGVGRVGRSGPGGKEWAGGEGVGWGEKSRPGGKASAGGKGVGRGGRSRPGRIGLLYVIYPNFQDLLFDFLKRFQETEPFHFTEALQLFITQRHFCNSFPAIKVSN